MEDNYLLLLVVCSACQLVADEEMGHKKAQKAQNKSCLMGISLCALCAFLWLKRKKVRVDPPSEPYMVHPHSNTGKIPPRSILTLCV
jgi:hypothetical protein